MGRTIDRRMTGETRNSLKTTNANKNAFALVEDRTDFGQIVDSVEGFGDLRLAA